MQKIKFKKIKQKEFIENVISALDSPSLRGLLQFGLSTNYSALKNYYNERRLIPKTLFEEMCSLAKITPLDFSYKILQSHWGQSKGGRKSKRTKSLKVVN